MIEKIFAMGDDALGNLFEMSIGTIPFIADTVTTVMRVQGFTIPGTGVGTYEVNYKTQKITKPNGLIDAPNEFSFSFRVDRSWAIYKAFKTWKNAVANSTTGTLGPDNIASNLRVPISVWAIDGSGLPITGFGRWNFKGCWVSKIGDIAFDYTSGDPIICDVTMNYIVMDDILV